MGRSGLPERGGKRLLCALTAFALVASLELSPAWYSGAVTAQEAATDVASDPLADVQAGPMPAPAEIVAPAEVPVAPEIPAALEILVGLEILAAANSPVPAATCAGLAVGSVVRLATTPDEFICAADGQMHWAG